MLYVYYGNDTDASRRKVRATVSNMLAKNPEALHFRVTTDTFHEYSFEELAQSHGLFKSDYIVVLDSLFSTKEGEEAALAHLELLTAATHPFLLLDETLRAPVLKKLEKHAEKVHVFNKKEGSFKASFNSFALSHALGERNTKKLWTLFREAKFRGVSDEEIHGVLFWMLKSIMLAMQSNTAEEAGMKAYPFSKAKSASRKFDSHAEVSQLIHVLALMPQHARRRGVSLEILLERFILAL